MTAPTGEEQGNAGGRAPSLRRGDGGRPMTAPTGEGQGKWTAECRPYGGGMAGGQWPPLRWDRNEQRRAGEPGLYGMCGPGIADKRGLSQHSLIPDASSVRGTRGDP